MRSQHGGYYDAEIIAFAGPWILAKNTHGWFLKTKDGCVIGGINRFPETAELASKCEPNARLIKVAPDLLEFVEFALVRLTAVEPSLEEGSCGNALLRKGRSILAKAGGGL